jgi:hypothetical protein
MGKKYFITGKYCLTRELVHYMHFFLVLISTTGSGTAAVDSAPSQ